MSSREEREAAARGLQRSAATDPASAVRLIAGPGTGKSFSIVGRARWLLEAGVDPKSIQVVSFTRASTEDLRSEFVRASAEPPVTGELANVAVSTLHSFALRTLRLAEALSAFGPLDPVILSDWEQAELFDREFAAQAQISPTRARQIRTFFEEYWALGREPQRLKRDEEVSAAERSKFERFHTTRSVLYACLLSGEAVRQCVERIKAGTLNVRETMGVSHLIVDEYQDLSPVDVVFIDSLIEMGVSVFVCGDDDQSIYSFRYGSPEGLRGFHARNSGASSHTLRECFRCPPRVLQSAEAVMKRYGSEGRLPKDMRSIMEAWEPPLPGTMTCVRFTSDRREAQFVAGTAAGLLERGVAPAQILVLLPSPKYQLAQIVKALEEAGVPFSARTDVALGDTDAGRVLLSLLRVGSPGEYVGYRTLLALLKGVGTKTAAGIAQLCIEERLTYGDLFNHDRVPECLSDRKRALGAVERVREVADGVRGWSVASDLVGDRREEIAAKVGACLGSVEAEFAAMLSEVPDEATLEELRMLLQARDLAEYEVLLAQVVRRVTATPGNADQAQPSRVRLMTLHSSKGLGAQVVFLPGLEEGILPRNRALGNPGQIEEEARLLYVGLTRAKRACIATTTRSRMIHGKRKTQSVSRLCAPGFGAFQDESELSGSFLDDVVASCGRS